MLTLMKFIHMLNRRSDSLHEVLHQQANVQPKSSKIEPNFVSIKNRQIAIGLQTIGAIIMLGVGGLGRIEPTQAKSLDSASIDRGLLPVANRKIAPNSTRQTAIFKLPQIFAQNTSATPTPNNNTKLQNNLNLPKTGNEVQITGNKSLTL